MRSVFTFAGGGWLPRWACGLWLMAGLSPLDPGGVVALAAQDSALGPGRELAPVAVTASRDGARVYLACASASQLLEVQLPGGQVGRTIRLSASPSGLALSADGSRLYVTCAAPISSVAEVACATGELVREFPAGHTAMAPVVSLDGRLLYVCNRFDNEVQLFSLPDGKTVDRIPVPREPVAAALTPDGRTLVVANHLHRGRADVDVVAAEVTLIDTASRTMLTNIALPNGSGLLRGVAISPDGRFAAITHVFARYYLPTTQVDRGWMNSNALTLIDLNRHQWFNTILLDDVDRGAANPWAVAWAPDGGSILVTHAGTHELSVIDASALLDRLAKSSASATSDPAAGANPGASAASGVPNDLAFLVGVRRRVPLPVRGPRSLTLSGGQAIVAGYFSDDFCTVDLGATLPHPVPYALAPPGAPTTVRQGEQWFNDAALCFQGWQSCASCHSSDARVDGLNWDLLNDGIGNPKNTHSLLLSHRTPPAMSEGVRDTAETAVRAGIQHILFSVQPEGVAVALDDYLKALRPIASPHLVNGRLSEAAERGRKLFLDRRIGCAECHPPGLFTTLKAYDVGTRAPFDNVAEFDTPTLIELWRTAPYLHDGSAGTVRDVLTTRNLQDQHGRTSRLTAGQLDDLAAYLLSL